MFMPRPPGALYRPGKPAASSTRFRKLPRRQQQKVLEVVSAIVEQFKRKAS